MFEPNTPTARDLELLRECIALARAARNLGQHPFAALVADKNGTIIAVKGNNSRPPEGDPTQHAELRAVAEAAIRVSPETLGTATLYSSAEPCAMCAGATYWSGIGRVVYALAEEQLLELTGNNPENPTLSLPCREVFARGQREITVLGPLLQDEAGKVHEGFWQ